MQHPQLNSFDLSSRSAGERLIVWGIRTLVAERRAGIGEAGALAAAFGQFGASSGVASLERLLDVFPQTAHAPLLLHPVGCRCLSPGETDLLGVVAAAQRGDTAAMRAGLAQWLPRHALNWAETPLVGLARTFAMAGLYVPHRPHGIARRPGAAVARPTLH